MIGNYPFPGVEGQDEAEAAIFIGSDRSSANLFVLTDFRLRAQNIIGVDSGVGRLMPAPGGFVAIFPDLAAAGPGTQSVNGWLPTRADRYTDAHPRPADNRYGTLTITTQVDQDRGAGSDEPLSRTTVAENNRRENTFSRTISSLQLN
ncbi:MAG TPA: hypothetical protein VFV67_23240 [Actinophytocola sp.]|uniref:hypothetical protein n=1 Tax=Actinophytocola sp. TaxID=1872138 RepID=UPI002DBB7E2A|nr:hypothetical protein [Actinophytocola sp.]HEU5473572.1 hypothetical protein [Actinophytocola sp.]